MGQFLGKQDSAGKKRLIRRAVVMVPLNIIFTLLRLPVNIAKLVFEVAPLSISNILKDVGDDLLQKDDKCSSAWLARIY